MKVNSPSVRLQQVSRVVMPIQQEKEIFLSALEFESETERNAYLANACGIDLKLRKAIDDLIAAHLQESNLLDQSPLPCVALREQVDQELSHLNHESTPSDPFDTIRQLVTQAEPPDRLSEIDGNYQLLKKIGEGGFGQVYIARQLRPVRRDVAIKVLKFWTNSREILARFEAERQALAMMDHPHIAQVFDAGTTVSGQPYFVMELVRGVSITDFCAQNRLTIFQRLELFIHVCQAIQHAHLKGIIHRDLKPSNVIVTMHDGTPVPKVIDFGVSKAMGEPLTEKTIHTSLAQMIGTPMYMSPEQADMSFGDVDTRSDVYSLGMMLYELLTETTPYDSGRLRAATFDELRRIIREEELPSPSSRLGHTSTSPSEDALQRSGAFTQRRARLRGDLDWIVMKAIEKNRTRRYETVNALSADLRRYLDNEPIEARPPSTLYRFSKFARRNKVTITTASLVAAAMIAGTGISLWQAAVAFAERDQKETARREAVQARNELEGFVERFKEANILLASGRAHSESERWPDAFADYNRATQLLPKYYHVWAERGAFSLRLGLWHDSAQDYAQALALDAPVNGADWWGIPQLLLYTDQEAAYRQACRELLTQNSSDTSDFSISTVRSCVFATKPLVDSAKLLEWAERLLNERDDFGPKPREFAPPRHQDRPPLPEHGPRNPDDQRGPDPGSPHAFGPRGNGPGNGPSGGPGGNGPGGNGPGGNGPGGFGPPRPGGPRPPGDRGRLSQPRGANLYLSGLACYRAGQFQKAFDRLSQSLEQRNDWPGRMICYPVLALVHHQLGHPEEAQQALATTEKTLDRWLTSIQNSQPGEMPVPWFDLVECLLLHREATLALKGTKASDDPRLNIMAERARAALK